MKIPEDDIEALRERAHSELRGSRKPIELETRVPADMADAMRLVEELRVYQTELEIQNQDLQAAQLQTELAMIRYRRLFENLPMEGLIIDAQGFIVEANAVARTRFSLRRQPALQRRSVYQIFAMDSRVSLHAALDISNDVVRAPHCQLAANDTSAHTEVDAHIITLTPESETVAERLMVLVDRTFERELAVQHEEVLRSEERYRALFDRSKVPMLLIDPSTGLIVRGNAAAQAFYGYDDKSLTGMSISNINCLSTDEIQVEMSKATHDRRDHFYFVHRLASGHEVPVEVHSGPIEIDGRTLLYSIVHDISARVIAQEEADQAHRLLTNLAAQVPGVIYQYQLFADGSSCFPYASEGLYEMYEVSPESIGTNPSVVFSMVHPDDLPHVSALITASFEALTPWTCEYRVVLPLKGQRWHRGIARPERQADGSTLWHGFIADITEHKIAEQRLAEFNRDFEAFLDQTTDFVYFKSHENRIRFCSQALASLYGQPNWRDMTGKRDSEMIPTEIAQAYEDDELEIFANGMPLLNKIEPYIDVAGNPGFVHTNKWPLFDGEGRIAGIFGISRDVTESRRDRAKIQMLANVFTFAREGILITDGQGVIVDVNDAFCRITGYDREDVVGKSPRMLGSGRQSSAFYTAMWNALNTAGHWEGEIWNRRKDGQVYAELLSISAISDNTQQVQNYVALFTDISQQKDHELELEHLARYDLLTALPNRALLADRLQQEMAHCLRSRKQLAVVFIDLDGFKQVNDLYGHDSGDQLLIVLAHRMKASLRDGDTLSRIGGDEFVAVLTGLDNPKDCEIVLARLLQAAAEPAQINGPVVRVSASIGVTLFPQDSASADQLMRHADHAMYQAKQAGKNRYHYFDLKDDNEVKSHSESLREIGAALEHGEFVLHYQPKVNMKTGALTGVEALIRWQHARRGLLAPQFFLPTIKEHPLTVKLGEWVIETAVAQVARWNATGLKTSVSVNIDAMHLQQENFVDRLLEILSRYPDVQPKQLDLEVLETSAMDDIDKVCTIMRACCEVGVGFSLDDFGTGYSSLTYLKRLPADLMKIDQSFVIGMVQDSDDFVIVEGVVGLAKAFGRNVLAEGVESTAHGELLIAMGCELGQGFGIARPMPAQELSAWTLEWCPDASWTMWNEQLHEDNHRDLVLAEIKHRHWLRDVENYVTGKGEHSPPLSVQNCPLGKWIASREGQRYKGHSGFDAVTNSHAHVHSMAQKLVDAFIAGQHGVVRAGILDLNAHRDLLIAAVRKMSSDG